MLFKDSDIKNLQVCKGLALELNDIYEYFDIDDFARLNHKQISRQAKETMEKFFSIVVNLDIFYALHSEISTDLVDDFKNQMENIKNKTSNFNFRDITIEILGSIRSFCIELLDINKLGSDFKQECQEVINDIEDIVDKIIGVDESKADIKSNINNMTKTLESLTISKFNKSLSASDEKLQKLYNQTSKKTSEYLEQLYDSTSKKTADILAKLQQETSDLQASTKQSITDQIEQIKTDLETSKKELIGLVGDLEAYKSIVNHETEKEVSKHYAKKATSEMITYWIATILSIVIIVVSICLAWSGLNGYFEKYVQETDPVKLKALAQTARYAEIYLGFRLVLSFLLFSTVIYTSRIAYRAYIHWRHSESMKLKLSSLRPFINQLEPDDRKQIHKDLVPDYFGKDAGMIDVAGEKFKDFPTNVSAVVMKAMEQANGALGNSKKDEPAKDDKNSAEKDKKEEA